MALSVETCAAQHIGDRKEQQDRVGLLPNPKRPGFFMALLADGMGGHSGGAMAAEQVILKGQQNFEAFGPADETPKELLRSIIEEPCGTTVARESSTSPWVVSRFDEQVG